MNQEALVCLAEALAGRREDPEALLRRADVLRRRLRVRPLTDRALREARDRGRR